MNVKAIENSVAKHRVVGIALSINTAYGATTITNVGFRHDLVHYVTDTALGLESNQISICGPDHR